MIGLIPMIGSAVAGGLASSVAHSIYGGVFTSGDIHKAQYELWKSPVALPDPMAMIRAVNMGVLKDTNHYGWMMRNCGAPTSEDTQGNYSNPLPWHVINEDNWAARKAAWDACREVDRPVLSIFNATDLLATNRITLREWKDYVRRAGGRPEDWDDYAKLAWNWPGLTTALAYWQRGLINDKCLDRLMDFERIPIDDCTDLRGVIRHSTHEIMGPSDLIRMAVKDAWDDNVAKALGYDEPFPPEFRQWMRKQGLAWPFSTEPGLQTQSKALDWAQLIWRAHWENVSPTQSYEMGHRLRKGRVPDNVVTPVVSADPTQFTVDMALKIADYPSEARKRLIAITYRIPSRSDLGLAYKYAALDKPQIRRAVEDIGYDPKPKPDGDPSAADVMTELITRQADQQRLSNPIGQSRTRVERAYEDGAVGRQEATALLRNLVFTEQESTLLLNMVDLHVKQRSLRDIIRGIRRNYLHGEYDRAEAEQALQVARVASDRIPDYLNRWQWSLHVRYRFTSAASLSNWLRRGFVGEGEVRFRLRRIGYTQEDISRIIGEVRRLQANDQRAEADKLLREAEKARREAEKAQQKLIAGLMRHSSPAKMKPRYLAGLMTEEEVRDILQLLKWTEEAINDELSLWNGERP
jgi:hypothetical protein